jgi:hypothetical protein
MTFFMTKSAIIFLTIIMLFKTEYSVINPALESSLSILSLRAIIYMGLCGASTGKLTLTFHLQFAIEPSLDFAFASGSFLNWGFSNHFL